MKKLNKEEFKDLLDFVLVELNKNKAEDVVHFDVSAKTDIAYYVIIASGRSSKHISSITENLLLALNHTKCQGAYAEGNKSSSGWILLDLDGVIIHLFHPEVRATYKIEELFRSTAKRSSTAPSH